MLKSRNLLWVLPLALLLGWPLYGGGLTAWLAPPELRESDFAPPEEQGQHFTMESVRLFQEVEGELKWRIDSERLRTGESADELLLTEVEAVFFREQQEQMWIDARRGRYHTDREILELEENVHLLDADGFSLTTPALSYHEREGKLSSRAGVEILADDLEARGRYLDYYLADGRYRLSGEVNFLAR